MANEKFSDVPVRSNGQDTVTASWWNDLRAAGVKLESVLGPGTTAEVQGTIADNQASYANITGMTVDSADYVYAEIKYCIYRTNGTSDERRETGTLELEYLPISAAWRIADRRATRDSLRVDDSMAVTTTLGVAQVRYKSDSVGGTYVGKIRWKIINTISVET